MEHPHITDYGKLGTGGWRGSWPSWGSRAIPWRRRADSRRWNQGWITLTHSCQLQWGGFLQPPSEISTQSTVSRTYRKRSAKAERLGAQGPQQNRGRRHLFCAAAHRWVGATAGGALLEQPRATIRETCILLFNKVQLCFEESLFTNICFSKNRLYGYLSVLPRILHGNRAGVCGGGGWSMCMLKVVRETDWFILRNWLP